jgi:hypothetical protein
MRTKTIYFIIICCIIPYAGVAQTDSIAKRFKKEFNTFNQSIQQKHQLFREKNDSLFSKFLIDSWASFDVLYSAKPIESKPLAQPVIEQPANEIVISSLEISADSSKTNGTPEPIKSETEVKKSDLPKPVESGGTATLDIDFYGSESKLTQVSGTPQISGISAEGISAYFNKTSSSALMSLMVSELLALKQKLSLNDWGYYKLIENYASKLEMKPADKTLLEWVILIKSGYNAKIGYTGETVYLLLPFQEELYNNYFIEINGQEYYIPSDRIKDVEIKQLTVHKVDYPGNSSFSLKIFQLPDLGNHIIQRDLVFRGTTLTVNANERLINFERDYPICEMKVYFSSPLSENVMSSLEKYFNPLFSGITDKEKVAKLLEFTQKAFPYKSDKDQFSREKYFFPDELFFYPFSDCEDRAILFSQLVKHFTNLNCIALDYPGHVNTAVNFREETKGSFITLQGTKYIVCDPTYINAPIGYLPEEFRGITPKVIIFD